MSPIIQVSKQAQFNKLVSRDRLTVVLYFAQWCGYCRIFDPSYERIAASQQFKDTLQFCSIDCTEDSKELGHLQGRAKVEGFPHIAVFRGAKLFCQRSGYCEYGTLKIWLMDCIFSHSISRAPGRAPKSLEVMQRLHDISNGGQPHITRVSTFDEIDSIASETTHLIVAFYKQSRPFASAPLWIAWETVISKPEFEHVQFASYDCENDEERANDFFLQYQSRCWFFRRATMFSEWKSGCNTAHCEDWLVNCLRASQIADSTITEQEEDLIAEDGTENADESNSTEEQIQSSVSGVESETEDTSNGEEAEEGAENEDEDEDEDDSAEENYYVTYVSSESQWQELLSENKNVVLSFYDTSNPYSQAMLVVLESVASSSSFDSVTFCAIDSSEEAAEGLDLKSCPDARIYTAQREVCRTKSPMTQDEFKKWINDHVNPELSDGEANRDTKTERSSAQHSIEDDLHGTNEGRPGELNTQTMTSLVHVPPDEEVPITIVSTDSQEAISTHPPVSPNVQAEEQVVHVLSTESLVVSPSANLTSAPTSASSEGAILESASLQLQIGNHSTSTLATISSTTTYSLPPCTGDHHDRPKSRIRWLGRRQPFHDPEPGCVFVPTEDGQGLQIGRANEGDSYFNITLSQSHDDHERDNVSFGVGFGPDPTMKTRFVSAVFRVTFGYDDDQGKRVYLKIRDLSPKDEHGEATEVHWGKGSDNSVSLSVGYSSISLGGESKRSKNADYTRKTSSRVRGQGVHTPSAEWTFQEDEGEAGQHGLDPQYQMSVTLPHIATTRIVWMEFWGKAVLARGRSFTGLDVTLKIGSAEEPYKRNLDLTSGVSTAR